MERNSLWHIINIITFANCATRRNIKTQCWQKWNEQESDCFNVVELFQRSFVTCMWRDNLATPRVPLLMKVQLWEDGPISFHCVSQVFHNHLATCHLVRICYRGNWRDSVVQWLVHWTAHQAVFCLFLDKTLNSHSAVHHRVYNINCYSVNSMLRANPATD